MLIALRPISLKVSAAGSIAGIVIFLTTLSFLVTTPGVLAPDSPAGGFLNETQRMDDDAIHAADDPEGYEKAAPGTTPDPKAVAAMMKYNESLKKAGVLLRPDGLHPPSMGARISVSGGRPLVTDGPFVETREVIGG